MSLFHHFDVQEGPFFVSCSKPHKTLGHWKAPAGIARTQTTVLKDKVKLMNLQIATSSVSRYGARLAYHAIVVATLQYVLPQCHFTKAVLQKAERHGLIKVCPAVERSAQVLYIVASDGSII